MGLLRAGHAPIAFAYLFGTVLATLLATWTGLALARRAAGLGASSGTHLDAA